jgi:putative membrane protein
MMNNRTPNTTEPGEGNDQPAGVGEAAENWRVVLQRPSTLMKVGQEPDYRFSLANERTFLAWIRTALALLAGGVAVIKLVPSFSVSGGRHLLGIPLVMLSLLLSVFAYRHWLLGERAMRLNRALPASILPPILAGALSLITISALILVLAGAGVL